MKKFLTIRLPLLIILMLTMNNCSVRTSAIKRINHVGLSVLDVKASSQFFVDMLGFKIIKTIPDYPAIFVANKEIKITLWQVKNSQKIIHFNRKNNIGLHHLAFEVSSLSELNILYRKLKEHNITIEFPPEAVGDGLNQHMIFYGPSGVRLEIFAKITD